MVAGKVGGVCRDADKVLHWCSYHTNTNCRVQKSVHSHNQTEYPKGSSHRRLDGRYSRKYGFLQSYHQNHEYTKKTNIGRTVDIQV